MNIHEYQAKALSGNFGVSVSRGRVAFTSAEAMEAAQENIEALKRAGVHIADSRAPRNNAATGAGGLTLAALMCARWSASAPAQANRGR